MTTHLLHQKLELLNRAASLALLSTLSFRREWEVAEAEHKDILKKFDAHKRQLQETHNEARKVNFEWFWTVS